jgi:hypothetical protein
MLIASIQRFCGVWMSNATNGWNCIRGESLRQKMMMYNKYDNVQWIFSWWQSFGNPKFKNFFLKCA